MKPQIAGMIEHAGRPRGGVELDGHRDTATRLASEAIRLARLAASAHMVLSARSIADGRPATSPVPRPAARKSAS